MEKWRELTRAEKGCIQKLLCSSDWTGFWHADDFVCSVLDEFGSLALSLRASPAMPNLVTSPIVSGYFSDNDRQDFPVGEILLFERDGTLTELQVYRSDGLPLKRELDPSKIMMIRQDRKPTVA